MGHTIRQVFRSGKFVVGFTILMSVLLVLVVYPWWVPDPPLQILGQGTFFPPGIYVSAYDASNAPVLYTLNLRDAADKRIESRLSQEDRLAMQEWLVADGLPESAIDLADTDALLALWEEHYEPDRRLPGMTFARMRYYQRVDAGLASLRSAGGGEILAARNPETGELEETGMVKLTDYANISQVANVRILPLGTDNFGRDVLTQLVAATGCRC